MLVVTRRAGQAVVIADCITVEVVEVQGIKVRVGVVAPREIPIWRKEIHVEGARSHAERMRAEGARRFIERTWTA
ncbi:MAG TPA: carbon storage regulator [Solirubrobacteraceae bacterium]|nr:carbon storage regulator [Solirubrobacteraceae bacterium]